MAKAAKPAPAAAAESAEGEAPKPKSKKMLLIVAGVLILAIAGGAGWFFLKGKKPAEAPKVAAASEPPIFVPLDAFTVNLQHDEADQFLNIGITLKVSSLEIADKVHENMPEIRSHLLFLLSSKHGAELVPLKGKKKLGQEIINEVNKIIGVYAAAPEGAAHEEGAAASGVAAAAESGVEAHPAETHSAEAASAPAPVEAAEVHGGEPHAGVVDVLYTAFIIQ